MQELNLTIGQGLVLIIMLVPLVVWGFKHLGTVIIEQPQENKHEEQLNPNYGRYIQLAGKRYN